MANMKCRLCDEMVVVAETTSGKTMPLDAVPVTGFRLSMDAAGKQYADAVSVYKPHVCAQPNLLMKV